jgi:large subunit ribosomal protein L3
MTARRPRWGSLQFYPRKRAAKALPSINWNVMKVENKEPQVLGFIAYKVAMATAIVKDSTDKSMTQNKRIPVPVTILEVPSMKVYSVRFLKAGKIVKDVVVSNDKELARVIRLPKEIKAFDSQVPADYDNIRLLVYSLAKQTSVKKTPDMTEVAIAGENKLEVAKSLIGKELSLKDLFKFDLVDVRGLTTGKGLVGTIKRFGLTLKSHKSEKGRRRPGSLAPWHPARITFKTPMAGQLGMFTRVHYNQKVITTGSIAEKNINPGTGFKNYGKIKSNFIVVKGSVQGPTKRQVVLTPSFRATKKTAKTKLEFIELKI